MIYKFKDHTTGTTFEGVDFQLVVNKSVKDITGCLIQMYIVGTVFTVASGHLSLTDAVKGKFRFNRKKIDLPAGVHYYYIKFTFSNGDVKIYLRGNWRIRSHG